MPETTTDHRRATAERNIEAILNAAEALLARGAAASTTSVAAEAGVSRVTVYAHFPTREALLEAVAERAVRRATTAIKAVELERGPALTALDRLIAAAWSELDRNRVIAQAASESLGPTEFARAHEALYGPLAALVERGQKEGAFRQDLPKHWMVTSYFSLMHACGDEVRAGKIDEAEAVAILQGTLRGLFVGPARRASRR